MADWRRDLLKRIGAPVTQANLGFLSGWQRWEGGHTNNDARFNWLNTTNDAPGAVGEINSVGVKRFDTYKNGINATAITLNNGRYGDILDALASGDPYKVAPSAGLQVWVTGKPDGNPGYAAKVLGLKTAPVAPPARSPRAKPPPVRLAATPKVGKRRVSRDVVSMVFGDEDPFWQSYFERSAREDPVPGTDLQRVPANQPAAGGKGGGAFGDLVKAASTQLGKPYVFGSGPDTNSFDCSDLLQWAYKQIGVNISRTTFTQIKEGRSVKGQKYQPGDLIFPHKGHVVMYVGNGKVIAAPYTGTVVQYQDVPKSPLEVRRIL